MVIYIIFIHVYLSHLRVPFLWCHTIYWLCVGAENIAMYFGGACVDDEG